MRWHERATEGEWRFSNQTITATPPTSPRCTDDFRRFSASSQTSTRSLLTPTPSEVTNQALKVKENNPASLNCLLILLILST